MYNNEYVRSATAILIQLSRMSVLRLFSGCLCHHIVTHHMHSSATTDKEALLVAGICNKVSALVVAMTLQDKIKSFMTARTVYGNAMSLDKMFAAMTADKFPFYGNSIGTLKHLAALTGERTWGRFSFAAAPSGGTGKAPNEQLVFCHSFRCVYKQRPNTKLPNEQVEYHRPGCSSWAKTEVRPTTRMRESRACLRLS
jgi:hypothetical protein